MILETEGVEPRCEKRLGGGGAWAACSCPRNF